MANEPAVDIVDDGKRIVISGNHIGPKIGMYEAHGWSTTIMLILFLVMSVIAVLDNRSTDAAIYTLAAAVIWGKP